MSDESWKFFGYTERLLIVWVILLISGRDYGDNQEVHWSSFIVKIWQDLVHITAESYQMPPIACATEL